MALVMLPCDLPWWPAVVKQLDKAASAKSSEDLIDTMQRLHDMCKYATRVTYFSLVASNACRLFLYLTYLLLYVKLHSRIRSTYVSDKNFSLFTIY